MLPKGLSVCVFSVRNGFSVVQCDESFALFLCLSSLPASTVVFAARSIFFSGD